MTSPGPLTTDRAADKLQGAGVKDSETELNGHDPPAPVVSDVILMAKSIVLDHDGIRGSVEVVKEVVSNDGQDVKCSVSNGEDPASRRDGSVANDHETHDIESELEPKPVFTSSKETEARKDAPTPAGPAESKDDSRANVTANEREASEDADVRQKDASSQPTEDVRMRDGVSNDPIDKTVVTNADVASSSKPEVASPIADEAGSQTTGEGEAKPVQSETMLDQGVRSPQPGKASDGGVKPTHPDTTTVETAKSSQPDPSAAIPAPDIEMTDRPDEDENEKAQATENVTLPSKTDEAAPIPSISSDAENTMNVSQPAARSASPGSSPTLDAIEVRTPGIGSKIAREREDDTVDEPIPKRAKTEPTEDEKSARPTSDETPAAPESKGLDMTALSELSQWDDAELVGKALSPYQRREIRKVIARVKKTKSGANFRDSVQKLWPALWEGYSAKVDKPMDFAELDRKVRDISSSLISFGDFRNDLACIFENSLSFNGPHHDITEAAANTVRAVWEEVMAIPAEEPARPKAVPKPKPLRESRAASNMDVTTPKPSAASVASPSTNATSATKPTHDHNADRRGSAVQDADRPKRTVRAPKPKDIDYTKSFRKKLKPELQFCDAVLSELMSPKHYELNKWFLEPVDAEGLGIPDYYSVIKKPMDLGQVQRLLLSGEVSSSKEFEKLVRLVFDNCYKFNGPVEQMNPISILAKQLEDVFSAQMKTKESWLVKHAGKTSAPPTSTSFASDEEEEEDEDGGDGDDAVDSSTLEDLQAKLEEETRKLNGMLLGGNQSFIEIQKGIVDVIQNALIKAAQTAQSARPKGDKSKKAGKAAKAGKGGKSRPAGGAGGGRKSNGGAIPSKKSGGSKKAANRRKLTAAEKDRVVNAIGELDAPYVNRAIELIKNDTGQNENPAGELELDIDQLSEEALIELFDICKAALPGFASDLAPPKGGSGAGASKSAAAAGKQASKSASKSKKNKPMSATEQDAKIAQLRETQKLFKPDQEPARMQKPWRAPTPMADSSDDSDSEEE